MEFILETIIVCVSWRTAENILDIMADRAASKKGGLPSFSAARFSLQKIVLHSFYSPMSGWRRSVRPPLLLLLLLLLLPFVVVVPHRTNA
jgi:hypothetical protein